MVRGQGPILVLLNILQVLQISCPALELPLLILLVS